MERIGYCFYSDTGHRQNGLEVDLGSFFLYEFCIKVLIWKSLLSRSWLVVSVKDLENMVSLLFFDYSWKQKRIKWLARHFLAFTNIPTRSMAMELLIYLCYFHSSSCWNMIIMEENSKFYLDPTVLMQINRQQRSIIDQDPKRNGLGLSYLQKAKLGSLGIGFIYFILYGIWGKSQRSRLVMLTVQWFIGLKDPGLQDIINSDLVSSTEFNK